MSAIIVKIAFLLNKKFRLMRYITIFILFLATLSLSAQGITVIHIQGDVKTSVKSSKKSGFVEKTVNLGYGPVQDGQSLVLTNKSVVKLIKDNKFQCEITGPGTFSIKDLKFEKIEEKSTLSTFFDYFRSFFVAHPNSESKEYYSNSIAAISKGEMVMPPLLAFPFPGSLPLIHKELKFSWDVSCDTCTYVLVIQDVEKKEIILREETKNHYYTLKKPAKLFEVNKKYLWLIEVKNSKNKSMSQFFIIADSDQYKSKISNLEKSFEQDNPYLTPVTNLVSIYAALEKEKLTNFMILYGEEQMKKYPKDASIKDIYNRVFYDNMKRKRI